MKLNQKILELQKVLSYAQKDTQAYNYKYVSGSSFLPEARKTMDYLGLILETTVEGIEQTSNGYIIKTVFNWLDAESEEKRAVTFVSVMPLTQKGRDLNQVFGSFLTYTERYFFMKYFHIPTDDLDPDAFQTAHKSPEDVLKQINACSTKDELTTLWKELEEIEEIAMANEGELPEELLQQLVEKNAESLVQIGKLIRYVKHLDHFVKTAKEEKQRINDLQKQAENRQESIKRYLMPFIRDNHNGKIDVGTFKLSVRKSEAVILNDNFNDERYCNTVITIKPDKPEIKKALKNGFDIDGARLEQRENLNIK